MVGLSRAQGPPEKGANDSFLLSQGLWVDVFLGLSAGQQIVQAFLSKQVSDDNAPGLPIVLLERLHLRSAYRASS